MGNEQQGSSQPADPADRSPAQRATKHAYGTTAGQSASQAPSEDQIGVTDDGREEAAEGSAGRLTPLGFRAATAEAAEDGTAFSGDGPKATIETDHSEEFEQAGRIITLDEIEGHVLRGIRYHEARARFLDFWRRVLDFLVIVLGAGAVSAAAGEGTIWGTVIGITLAGIGAIQLVAGFSEKAGEHASLKRRFCGVLAEITEARGEPDRGARRLSKITKKWTAIWADEPPTMHVLEAIAHNAARRALEYELDEGTLIEIGRWHSWTRNLSSWERFEPLTRAERAVLRDAKMQARPSR